MSFRLPIKIQNFLFLLGVSVIVSILYLPLQFLFVFVFFVIDEITLSISRYISIIILILGIINLCSNKVAQYIYDKSTKNWPRLQWYSMFFSWIAIVMACFDLIAIPLSLIASVFISCMIGALFYPNRTWKKRIFSAIVFFSIFLFLIFTTTKKGFVLI